MGGSRGIPPLATYGRRGPVHAGRSRLAVDLAGGRVRVTGGAGRRLEVWDLRGPDLLHAVVLPPSRQDHLREPCVQELVAAPDSPRVLVLRWDRVAFLVDAAAGRIERELARSRRRLERALAVAFLDEERILQVSAGRVAGDAVGFLRTICSRTGAVLRTHRLAGDFRGAAIAPGRRGILVSTPDGPRGFRVDDGAELDLDPADPHGSVEPGWTRPTPVPTGRRPDAAFAVAASRGGRWVARVGWRELEVFERGGGEPAWRVPVLPDLDPWTIPEIRVHLADDGSWLVLWISGYGPRVWRRPPEPGVEPRRDDLFHTTLRFPEVPALSPDGSLGVSLRGRVEEISRIGIMRRGVLRRRDESVDWSGGRALRIRVSGWPVPGRFRGSVTSFDLASGEVLAEASPFGPERLRGPAISPDSCRVAVGTRRGELAVLDLPDLDSITRLPRVGRGVQGVGFGPAGRLLVVASRARGRREAPYVLGFVDLRRGGVLGAPARAAAGYAAARLLVSPFHPILAVVERPTRSELGWRIRVERFELREGPGGDLAVHLGGPVYLRGYGGEIRDAAFALDGIHLVAGWDDGGARIWDLAALLPA